MRRFVALILTLLIAACTVPILQNHISLTSVPTLGPLTKTVYFWYLGVSVTFNAITAALIPAATRPPQPTITP